MALSPLRPPAERAVIQTQAEAAQPSRTYRIDFDSGRMRGMIDGESALRQFIRKAVATARYRYLIYDGRYGCEADQIIGANVTDELLRAELPRVIREALIYDERISDVSNFAYERNPEDDRLYVTFTVTAADGYILDERAVI